MPLRAAWKYTAGTHPLQTSTRTQLQTVGGSFETHTLLCCIRIAMSDSPLQFDYHVFDHSSYL